MKITHTLQFLWGGALMAFIAPCWAQQAVEGLDHDEVHSLSGSSGGTDVILDVAAGVE